MILLVPSVNNGGSSGQCPADIVVVELVKRPLSGSVIKNERLRLWSSHKILSVIAFKVVHKTVQK